MNSRATIIGFLVAVSIGLVHASYEQGKAIQLSSMDVQEELLSEDRTVTIIAYQRNKIKIVQTESGHTMLDVQVTKEGEITHIGLSPDARLLLVATSAGKIKRSYSFDPSSFSPFQRDFVNTVVVDNIVFSPTGNWYFCTNSRAKGECAPFYWGNYETLRGVHLGMFFDKHLVKKRALKQFVVSPLSTEHAIKVAGLLWGKTNGVIVQVEIGARELLKVYVADLLSQPPNIAMLEVKAVNILPARIAYNADGTLTTEFEV